MTAQLHAPHVVLGAGAMGTAAAYHLARRGRPVLLVEQFAQGHDRGSSHGAARITRFSYTSPLYAGLMRAAFDAWRDLEADTGQNLYLRTGGASVCPDGVEYVGRVAATLEAIGVPHRRFSGEEWNRIHPAFGLPPDDHVVFEPDAGMLAADRALAVQLDGARRHGGDQFQLLERTRVQRIDLESGPPTLITDRYTITADRLIVTAGAWTSRLLPGLTPTLTPTRQQVLYFRPYEPAPYALGRLPVFIFIGHDYPRGAYYGMPATLGRGVKVARHGGPVVDPDQEDRSVGEDYIAEVRRFLARSLPDLVHAPVEHTEICLYTMTDDENFVLGPLPGQSNVFVASPCSGHGFKFSCLIGRILADLAIEGGTDVEISPWSKALSVAST